MNMYWDVFWFNIFGLLDGKYWYIFVNIVCVLLEDVWEFGSEFVLEN